MTPAGIARVLACFENAEDIFPVSETEKGRRDSMRFPRCTLLQMSQLPQPQTPACTPFSDQEDAFEERAAIIEYEAGIPRPLAEFLAKKGQVG